MQVLFWICGDVSLLQGQMSKDEADVVGDANKCLRFENKNKKRQCDYLTSYVDESFLAGTYKDVGVAMFASKKLPKWLALPQPWKYRLWR